MYFTLRYGLYFVSNTFSITYLLRIERFDTFRVISFMLNSYRHKMLLKTNVYFSAGCLCRLCQKAHFVPIINLINFMDKISLFSCIVTSIPFIHHTHTHSYMHACLYPLPHMKLQFVPTHLVKSMGLVCCMDKISYECIPKYNILKR